jgi:peptidoglycan/LPS O-acetylase OafA/YrhL
LKYINGLNTLRGIAVLLVIRQHWAPYGFKSFPILSFFYLKVLPSGDFGVDFFFVLSGFLISNILIQQKEESDLNSRLNLIKKFIIRRSLRIFPIYFLCLLLLYIFNFPDVRKYIIYFATYTSNFLIFHQFSWNSLAHIWTLAVEEQFYLIWPVVIIFTPKKYLLTLTVSFIFFSTICNLITEQKYGYFAKVLTFNCFSSFAIGGLYAYSLINEKSGDIIKKTIFSILPLAVILYILYEAGIHTAPLRLINSIISISIIILVAENRYGSIMSAIINNKVLTNLGKISYGVYLYHYMVPTYYSMFLIYIEKKLNIYNNPGMLMNQPYVIDVFQFLILILISSLSYYFIEIKILKLKKHFEYDTSKR